MSDSQSNEWQEARYGQNNASSDNGDPNGNSYAAAAARGATVAPGETKPRKKRIIKKRGPKINGHDENKTSDDDNDDTDNGQAIIGHGEFFDVDGDGIIWPIDTLRGFLALGYSYALSVFAMIVICPMSYVSLPSPPPTNLIRIKFPDPFFRIRVDGLYKAKHGSDSGSFRTDGKFDEEQFDKFWDSHTDAPHDEMTPAQLYKSVSERWLAFDFYGVFAAIFEWLATWLLVGYPTFHFDARLAMQKFKESVSADITNGDGAMKQDKEGDQKKSNQTQDNDGQVARSYTEALALKIRKAESDVTVALKTACSGGNLKKEDVRGIYDGTIFYTMMKKQAKTGNAWAKDWKEKHKRFRRWRELAARA
ncbi:hypothetical protein D9757_004458 [Collybiopsis confluens]|uniref:Caleosin n=1 Tax=Collybiopsis confluens TaxID=2823264 RepID=A0A8H5MEN0_9AGAR|nr:hypothetical protein D9757_004458 [Collybiopsis confluens]